MSGPILRDIYSIDKHKSITGIQIIDNDNVSQDLNNQIQDLYSSYYEFNSHNQACWFNKEQQIKDKSKMLELLLKLKGHP